MKKSKGKVVDFSDLDEQNKTQFFDFLLKNNITFEQGQQNYIAKVSIKRQKQVKRKSLSQRNTLTNKSPKNIQRRNKENQYKEIKTPKKKNNILIKNKSTPVKDNLNNNNSERSKTKSERSFVNTKSKSNMKKKQYQKIIQTAQFEPSIKIKSVSKGKNKKVDTKREDKSLQAKKININLKKKINDQKQIFQLVAKYLKIFNLKLQGQRPIKWSAMQLLKSIEDIYDDTFLKNTQILQNKSNSLKKGCNIFIKCIKDHFILKFKSQKLGNYNLINMLHSLSIYIQKSKNYLCSRNDKYVVSLQIFEDFIVQVYQAEDLLFFLFARSMLKKEFKLNNKYKSFDDEQIVLNVKQISKFLICIVGKDSELIQDYKDMILNKIGSQKITQYEFLRILIQDYRTKRLLSLQEDNILFKDPTLKNLDNSLNQLTFGEDTQQRIQLFHDHQIQFWKISHRISQNKYQDQIYNIIVQKMKKKVIQFVSIIISGQSQYNSLQAQGHKKQNRKQGIEILLINKSISLLQTILQMNKIKWFQQLQIKDPSQDDIQFVQKLQINLRNLKKNPDAKGIGQFCKMILTVSQLTQALQKLLI